MLFLLMVLLNIGNAAGIHGSRYRTTEDICNCGIGGLCAPGTAMKVLRRVPCSKICPEVSKGFYENDCVSIVDYCSSSPCGDKGTCVRSFGGYFCVCHKEHFGKNCEIHDVKLTKLGVNPALYVYYQIQTPRKSVNTFSVVFDPSVSELETNTLEVQLVVNISDGRSYYPQRATHFRRMDVKSACVNDAKKNPIDRDERVCGYLPYGKLSTFTFEPSYYGSLVRSSDDVNIDGFGTIGRKGTVTIFVFVVEKMTKKIVRTIYNHAYHIFTYRQFRVPNHCLMDISFTSCSSDHRFPFVLARGMKIKLDVIRKYVHCNGSLPVGFEWKVQQHTDSEEPTIKKDPMPVLLPTNENDDYGLEFRSRFFDSGIHMIEYALIIRGSPPDYGSTNHFSTYGRCWIKIITHPPVLIVKGGEVQSVSCYRPLLLELENINQDIDINAIQFEASCNDTKDRECDKIPLDKPAIKKYNTACNTYLEFVVSSRNMELEPFSINVHFIDYPSSMKIECITNCYPINPSKRSLLIATTDRYAPCKVKWNVTRNEQPIVERDGEINAFYPLTATRIIRINGERFCDPKSLSSDVRFESRGSRNMQARISTTCINVGYDIDDFEMILTDDGITYKFERKVKTEHSIAFPVKYKIFMKQAFLLADVEVLETNYEEHLTFVPFWTLAQVCVYYTFDFFACTDWKNIEHVSTYNITTTELDMALYTHDYQALLRKVFVRMVFSTEPTYVDGKLILVWIMPASERLAHMNLVAKVPTFKRHGDFLYAIQITVGQFYSTDGNAAEKLVNITGEDFLTDVATTITHLQLRHTSLVLLERLVQTRYEMALEFPNLPYGPYEFGDIRTLMHFSLTLAHIQKGLIEALKPSRHQPVARQIQAGLVAFWVWKNNSAYVSAVRWYINLLAESTQLFNGIRVFGRFFSRAWVVRSTYGGIIEAFSRNSGLDHYPGCATFILESNKAEDGEWLDFIEVELPPTTIEWEYKQLTIVVVAAKNRKNDTSVSPLLLLSMRSMFGAPILNLPDNKPLNITLPRMWGGTLEPSRHRYLTDTIHRDHNWKDYSREINRLMTSYKIELPVEYDSWVVEIQVNVMVPLKVIVTDKIPDPLLLSAKPDIYPVYDSSKKKYLAYEEVLPAAGHQFIPSYFYLAISPSFESTNVTSITLNLQRTTDVCYVENTRFLEVDSTERSICKGLNRFGDYNTIQCNCKRLGLIQARRYPISINKLLIGEIPFIFPRNKFTYVNIIIIGIFISFIVATFVIAVCKDRSSQKQETLIYVEDNYPSDDYIMVVGVFTGLYLQGGTKSKVGIMLIGENSSSRVHILASRKRRTLATGQDDWFVITLPHPPGKITRISLWRDHRDMSGWFCDRIIVYDPSENTLYVASMEKWMEVTIMEETKKIQTLEVIQVGSVGNRGSVHDMSHTFTKNYVREYRNTHDLFSIYTMHSRYLVTYEVKSHIIIVKVCFIYFWVWFIQEVAHLLTNGQYLYPVVISGIADIRLETFTWALWAALLSHPFTYALDYFYRSAHLSRVLQKKTTNPYYLNTAAESLARSGSFSMRPSTRRITSGAPRQTRSSFKSHHRPSEFKYSKHTLGSNKFANSRIAHRRGYLRLAVGPSQFRCVDVNSETIALKTRKAETSVRFVSIFIFFSFLGFILYVQFWTAFTWKWKTSAFVFCFAIVLDVFILGPLFIFIKSSIAFYIYHLSNKEPFLMSDDVKVHQPLRTKYVDYLEKATRKEYKLPLNADINAAKRKKLIMITVKRTIFQVIALLAMYCVHDILVDKYNEEHFTLMRILKDATTAARNRHGFQGTDPKDVHDFTSASNYVSNTIAALTGIWPNGQRIGGSSRETGMRWTYDSFGQGMGSSSVLLLYIADTDEKLTVPLEFEEYFTAAIGYYSESFPEKDPLIISDTTLNYTVVSEMVIVGNSKEVYPLAGHLKLIPLKPWGTYYSQMRILMNDVMIKEEDHDCRAVIISTNYVYPYVQYLATVDVLIEFLPSGVSDVYIQTRGIKSGAMTHNRMKILRFIIAAILLCFLVYTFAAIGKVGIKAYFREPYNIIKFLIFLTNLATVVCYFLRYPLKYGAISRLIHAAINEYRDVHPIFVYELTDSILLLLFFTAMLVDFMLVIPKLIGSPWLNRLCISCIKIVFIALLLQLYLISLVKVTMRVMYRTFGLFFIIVHTHQPPTSIDHYAQVEGLAFFISVIVLTIFSKFVLSMVIYRSLLINAPKDLPLKMYVDILKRNHLDTEHSGRVFPVPAIFHWRSRTKSTESIGQNQQPNALSLMSGRVASKHQIFL